MDYRTYRKIRSYCRQDLRAYIDSPLNEDIHKRIRRKGGASAAIRDEQAAAMGLFQSEEKDLTPREQAAAHLLAVVLNHRAIAWHREPVTPDGCEPAAPLEPWQAAELWAQTRQAVTEYAAFIPEREAAMLLALIQDTAPGQNEPHAPVAGGDEKPWLSVDPKDPPIALSKDQPWYTPARYFARQLVIVDSTLLTKKPLLADKVSMSLAGVGIFKRGGKKSFSPDTVLKAFANVTLG